MGKNKLQRWREISEFENVTEYTDYREDPADRPKGKWSRLFGNTNPIVLELACGKGEYTLSMARDFSEKNFIGIDIKGARIWKGAVRAREESIGNTHFIRMFIDHLDQYFEEGEVSEIWITFPDPYLKVRKTRKRLTSPRFLKMYRKILAPGGSIHLKTDSDVLFGYTLETIESERCELLRRLDDVYAEAPANPLLTIQTYYEKSHLKSGKTIKYVEFRLPA